MTGVVTAEREAALRLTIRGPQGQEQEVEAVIDTGFNGFLALTAPLVAALGLSYHSRTVVLLGDGSQTPLREYEGQVVWDGQERDILILETDGGPLIGMALLYGYRVTLDVVDGGPVTIAVLP